MAKGRKRDRPMAARTLTMTKEEVYDRDIAPVLTKILDTCKENKIAMLADFGLDDDDLHCTSALLMGEFHPSEEQLTAFRTLRPKRTAAIAETIETKPDGSKHITMRFLGLILVLLFAGTASAQIERAKTPSTKAYKIQLISLALAESYDFTTTAHRVGSFTSVCTAPGTCTGYGWRETNPILGPHPSDARIAAYGAAEMVLFAVALHYTERSRFRTVKWTARVLTTATIANHVYLGTNNIRIR